MKLYYKIKIKIFSYFIKNKESVEYSFKRSEIDRIASIYGTQIFVETGTFLGDTVDYFKDKFKQVISIELSEELALKAKNRFINQPNVRIISGDSGTLLKELINTFNTPAIFWLDGHYSSEFMIGDEFIRTAKGETNTPVENELTTILKSQGNHIVMIDDARLFTGLDDYPSIGMIKRLVRKHGNGYQVKVENDIIYILK